MIRLGRRKTWWLIALATFLVVGALHVGGKLRGLENSADDARARLLRREVRSDVVIIGIDAASSAALDQWPWPRTHHAKLIEQLSQSAPRRVFFDVDFSSASNSLGDAVFDAALARRRNYPVVLPVFF